MTDQSNQYISNPSDEAHVGDISTCRRCSHDLYFGRYVDSPGRLVIEPDYDPKFDEPCWRHRSGYVACPLGGWAEPRPLIVVLCGSAKFHDVFREKNLEFTISGQIVLSIGCNTKAEHDLETLRTMGSKVRLDELHKRKIDLADHVYVINPGGYVGDSTRSEIEYAITKGKTINYMERRDQAS
jgi:hypothetical protein